MPEESQPLRVTEVQDRITGINTIHFQHFGDDPVSMDVRWNMLLKRREQPYQRRLVLNEKWVSLFAGCWIERPGSFYLYNRAGTNLTLVPSPEEKQAFARQKIRFMIGEVKLPFFIGPGRPGYYELDDFGDIDPKDIHISMAEGEAEVLLVVYSE